MFDAPRGWFGRLGVVYHAGTKKYVLIAQSGANLVLFASSDSPKGPFTHTSTDVPPGVVNGGTGDETVFQDDDEQRKSRQLPDFHLGFRRHSNPATYTIQASAPGEAIRLEMYTVNGKAILRQILVPDSGTGPYSLPVHRLERGQYLLKMISGGNSSMRKVKIAR